MEKFVRPLNRRPESIDMTPQLVEEYILETAERGQPRVYHTRLTILQRLANDEYIGELYVERDYKVISIKNKINQSIVSHFSRLFPMVFKKSVFLYMVPPPLNLNTKHT